MLVFALLAAYQGANIPLTVTAVAPKKAVAANHPFTVTLNLKFGEGLHGYQNPPSDEYEIPVTIKLKSGPVKVVSIAYPKGKDFKMAGADKPTKVYSGTIAIPVTLKATKSGPVVLTVDYQQCTDSNCFQPSSVEAKLNLKVGK